MKNNVGKLYQRSISFCHTVIDIGFGGDHFISIELLERSREGFQVMIRLSFTRGQGFDLRADNSLCVWHFRDIICQNPPVLGTSNVIVLCRLAILSGTKNQVTNTSKVTDQILLVCFIRGQCLKSRSKYQKHGQRTLISGLIIGRSSSNPQYDHFFYAEHHKYAFI